MYIAENYVFNIKFGEDLTFEIFKSFCRGLCKSLNGNPDFFFRFWMMWTMVFVSHNCKMISLI